MHTKNLIRQDIYNHGRKYYTLLQPCRWIIPTKKLNHSRGEDDLVKELPIFPPTAPANLEVKQ